MCRRAIALFCLSLLTAAPVMAQAPPVGESPHPPGAEPPIGEPQPVAPPPASASEPGEPQSGRVFCGQSVSYRLADPSTVPEDDRRFQGVWSDAAWDAHTCAALIVEGVKPDGAASVIYIFGPQGSSAPGPGGVLHGAGVIRGGELRFQNSDGTQFAFRPGLVDMIGHMINPQGESFAATFKATP
ncbi:MAG TPA: hypothetical protein VGM07_19255 [Stellaceae bacterium]|jgi:hypothetical protein